MYLSIKTNLLQKKKVNLKTIFPSNGHFAINSINTK